MREAAASRKQQSSKREAYGTNVMAAEAGDETSALSFYFNLRLWVFFILILFGDTCNIFSNKGFLGMVLFFLKKRS